MEGQNTAEQAGDVEYVTYSGEEQLPLIVDLIKKDLSEPYSIFTYRYFINNWSNLCFLVSAASPSRISVGAELILCFRQCLARSVLGPLYASWSTTSRDDIEGILQCLRWMIATGDGRSVRTVYLSIFRSLSHTLHLSVCMCVYPLSTRRAVLTSFFFLRKQTSCSGCEQNDRIACG